jgi:hypothetical protein
MITMLRRHGMTWHDMMTTRWARYTQSHYDIKKKIKIVSDELIDTHSINKSTSVKKFWHSTSHPARTYMRSATHDTTPQQHVLQQHDDLTTQEPLTTLQTSANTQQWPPPQQHVTKNFMTKSYTRSDRNNLYIMTSLCVTRWDKLSFTWFDERS